MFGTNENKLHVNCPIINYFLEELVLGNKPEDGQFFQIEKIVKKKKENGKWKYLVKYLGYDNRHNSWVSQDALKTGSDEED